MARDEEKNEANGTGQEGPSKLKCLIYNVGGLSEAQESELMHVIKTHKIDYAILLDTRKTNENLRYLRQRVRRALGPQFRMHAVATREKATAAQRIGGQVHG